MVSLRFEPREHLDTGYCSNENIRLSGSGRLIKGIFKIEAGSIICEEVRGLTESSNQCCNSFEIFRRPFLEQFQVFVGIGITGWMPSVVNVIL